MSLSLFNEFLENYKDPSEEQTIEEVEEKVCVESPVVVEKRIDPSLPKKIKPMVIAESVASPATPSSTNPPPPPSTPVPTPPVENVLEAEGILTDVGAVPIIDGEHIVRVKEQTMPLYMLKKGHHVRYSYVDKDSVRKKIVILECVAKAAQKEKIPVVAELLPTAAPSVPVPLPIIPLLEAAPPNDGTKQFRGTVKGVRPMNDLTVVDVLFENKSSTIIKLTEELCEDGYQPVVDDSVVVCCTIAATDEDDEDEDDEDQMVIETVKKVLTVGRLKGVGTVTMICDGFGVVDEDIYFLNPNATEELTAGTFVEFEMISCTRDEFKWRCLTINKTEKPTSGSSNENNYQEFLDNPENYSDHNGLCIANRDQLFFRMYAADQESHKQLIIRNTSDTPYCLLNLWFHSPKGRPQIRPRSTIKPTNIGPGSEIEVGLYAKGRFLCNHEESLIAIFTHSMCLVMPIRIAVGSDDVVRSVKARETQYQASRIRGKLEEEPEKRATQVFRAPKVSRKFVEIRIQSYEMPKLVWELMCLDTEEAFEEKCAVEFPFLSYDLTAFNYKERLHIMVHISEANLKKCFRVYEMKDLRFEKEGELFCLRLENLAESRPSVLLEDTVIAREGTNEFKGNIKKILNDRVLFEFHEQFGAEYEEKRFDVSFRYNRNPFQKLHHALDEMDKKYGEDFLFPSLDTMEEKEPLIDVSYDCTEEETDPEVMRAMKRRMPNGELVDVPWQNPKLNWHQKRAIVNALRGEFRPLPQLICGPPGTGKTSTLVELVLQQFLGNNQAHILVCTPSNSAANLILEKLIASEQLLSDHFMRVIGFQAKEREMIPSELLPFCGTVEKSKEGTEGREMTLLENGFRENCQKDYLCTFRVIVLTIGSVGTFMEMGFPEDHFTHLYVDEAGQCLETEIIIPMTLLSKATGHSVFVGDEKQLGPVVQFHPLVKWNYGVSLFERLQSFPMYNRNDSENYDQRLCYQLVNNYRSVPSILRVYNQLFYGRTLKPMVRSGGLFYLAKY